MGTLAKWSRKHNWRQWLTRNRSCCAICFHFGDTLGNSPDHGVLVVKGIEMYPQMHSRDSSLRNTQKGYRLHLKRARDAFRSHVKTHHEPEWLNERLEWSIKRYYG